LVYPSLIILKEEIQKRLESSRTNEMAHPAVDVNAPLVTKADSGPPYDLKRTRLNQLAEYLVAKMSVGGFDDMKGACLWASENCITKGKPVKYSSIYKVTSNLHSEWRGTANDAKKRFANFRKNLE
jgi:hypothetical protein